MPIFNGGAGQRVGLKRVGPCAVCTVEVPSALANNLLQRGMPIPSPVTGLALIDSGASCTAIDISAVNHLGLQPLQIVTVGTPGGPSQQGIYRALLKLLNPMPDLEMNMCSADLSGQGVPNAPTLCLLGRDFLEHCVFIYNGTTGHFSISF